MELTVNEMLDYLKKVCALENNIYQLNKLADSIVARSDYLADWYEQRLEYEKNFKKSDREYIGYNYDIADLKTIKWKVLGIIFIPVLIIAYCLIDGNGKSDVLFAKVLIAIVVGVLIYFITKYIKLRTEIDEKMNDIDNSNKKVIKRKCEYHDETMSIRKSNLHEIDLLEEQLEYVEQKIDETEEALNKLYSYNIIYEKYRNMPAVYSFYEFYKSGKCSVLTGHEGAYNLYDDLVFKEICLSKMDVIITNLNRIQQNQYLLYNAIQESNELISQVGCKIQNISSDMNSNFSKLKNDIELNNYFGKISALNSEIIKLNTYQ